MTSTKKGVLVTLAAAVAFGLYPPAAKMAYADGANVNFVIVVTTFARACALVVFCVLSGKSLLPNPSAWKLIVSGGFFQSVSIFGIIGSLAYLPGPVTIIIIFTHTIMLLFYMAYRGEIQLTRVTVAATLCALFGVSLVVDVWHNFFNLSAIGLSLAFMAAVATMSRLYVFGKQVLEQPPAVVGAQIFSVAFVFSLFLFLFQVPIGPGSLTGFVWVAVCCLSLVLGTFGMFYGISFIGSFRFSLMVKLEPVFTAIFSIILINEILNSYQYIGMALVVVSLVAYQYFEARSKARSLA